MTNRSLSLPFAALLVFLAGCPTPDPGGENTSTTTITLAGAAVTTEEDTPLRIQLTPAVTGDPGSPVELILAEPPAHGTVALTEGVFTYTPEADYAGPDAFRARARAGDIESAVALVEITVNPVNDAPTAADDAYALQEDKPFSPLLGLLVNDHDVDGDLLEASVVTPPSHGTLILAPEGTFLYTPDPDYFGADSFTYQVSDGADSASAAVALDVAPVNDAPSLESATLGGAFHGGVTAYVTAAGWSDADLDPPGYFYRWVVDGVTVPVAGAVLPATYVTSGAVLQPFVTPFDGRMAGAEVAAAPVTVPNRAPMAFNAEYTVTAPHPLEATLEAVDADGDALTYEIVTAPEHGALTLGYGGAVTYTPLLGYVGADSFAFRVSDGTGMSNTALVSLTIDPVPLPASIPHRYGIASGPLPASACDLDRAFGIVSMSPATDAVLQPNTTYDFTAVVSYAVKTTETVWLVAIDDQWNFHDPLPAEEITLEPSNGCAQTTVSLHGVTTGTSGSIEIKLDGSNGGGEGITGQAVTYFIAGAPSVRVVATDHPLDEPLVLGPDSTTTVTFLVAWNNVPDGWAGPIQTYSPSLSNFEGNWFALYPGAGTATVTVRVRPGRCTDDFSVVGFGVTNPDWSVGSWEQVSVYYTSANVMVKGMTTWAQTLSSAPQDHAMDVQNCTAAPMQVTVATQSSWIYPQAATVTIAPGATQAVTYATDAQSLAAGIHAGSLDLQLSGADMRRVPIRLIAASGSYVAMPTTFAWMTEAVTPDALVSWFGEDEVNHAIALPFPFPYYGVTADTIYVNTNGYVTFGLESDSDYGASTPPVSRLPLAFFVNWNDLNPDAGQGIYVATLGTAPNRVFVVTWDQIGDWGDAATTRTGQLVLYENSDTLLVQYATVQANDRYGTNVGDGLAATIWTPTDQSAFLVYPN